MNTLAKTCSLVTEKSGAKNLVKVKRILHAFGKEAFILMEEQGSVTLPHVGEIEIIRTENKRLRGNAAKNMLNASNEKGIIKEVRFVKYVFFRKLYMFFKLARKNKDLLQKSKKEYRYVN